LSKKKLKSDGNSKTYKFFKGCSDIIVWIFIIIVLGYLIKYFFVSNHSENVRSYEEMREDLTSAQDLLASKTDSLEMQNLVNGTLEAMDKFYESVQSIDSGSLYLDSIDYKNKNLLKKSIDSRNKFDSSVKEYSDDIGILFSNYEFLDDS
jgi:flagellar biosynthesis/type III secretory pathway chaperone